MTQTTRGMSTMTRKTTIATLVVAVVAAIGSAIPALAQETESTTENSSMGGQEFPTNHEDMEAWMDSNEHQDWMYSPEHIQMFNEMHSSMGMMGGQDAGSMMGSWTDVGSMMGGGSSPMTDVGRMGRPTAR